MSVPPRIAFSTLAFPDATLAAGRRARPPLGLLGHRTAAHRRRAHRPGHAPGPPGPGQAHPGRGRAARRRGGQWRLMPLGEGEVPVRDMLARLAAADYPHWISVEWEKRWHPEIEEPEVALPQHLDLLAAWLE